jgi:hypothetical protein
MLNKIIYYIDTGLYRSRLVEELLEDEEVNASKEEIEKQIDLAIANEDIIMDLEEDDDEDNPYLKA